MISRKWFLAFCALGLLSFFFLDRHVHFSITTPWLHKLANIVSILISPFVNLTVWPLAFLFRFMRKKGWFLCYISLSVGLSYCIAYAIKIVAGRARPYIAFDPGTPLFSPWNFATKFHSFPSGHAAISMALFTALSYIFPRRARLLTFLGILLPLTRVLLNKHFLGDVLIGEAIGYLVATSCLGKASLITYRFFGKILGVSHDPTSK